MHKDYFTVLNVQDLLFNDFGDRVAQLLHIQLVKPLSQNLKNIVPPEIIIVNTHLLFPHDSSLSIARLHQVYRLACSLFALAFFSNPVMSEVNFFPLLGLQDIAICRIISDRKSSPTLPVILCGLVCYYSFQL